METIPKSTCEKIGYVQKSHGLNGTVVIRFQEEFYETLEECPVIFLEIDQLLVPHFIADAWLQFKSAESVIVRLEWIDTDLKAKSLCGCAVYVHRNDVIELEEDLSLNALTGYTLYDETLGLIGVIDEVIDYSGNILLSVVCQGKEALIPFNEELLVRLDEDLKEIELRIPEGLFDLDDEANFSLN